MSDLIERLRGMNEYWQHAPLYNKAADRIEQLEAEKEVLRQGYSKLRAKIEQLEAALKDIVAADHCIGGDYCPHCIARTALEDKDA
jgi:polyhydroxyalkanoate synthesis regulator phasin